MFRFAAAAVLLVGLTALPARAADADDAGDVNTSAAKIVITTPGLVHTHRPLALPVLYGSLAGLQAYDVYSTRQGLALGAQERNPLMQGIAGNSTATIVAKTVSTAVTIAIAERLWHTNKTAAIATMIVANGVMGAVAVNNVRVLQQIH